MSKQRHIFYGWWVAVGLFIIGMLGPLGRYCMTAFLPFITTELGWSRSTIGLGQSLSLWMYALFALLSGFMVDRIGSRKTFLIGGAVTLAGWMLLSTIKSPWQLYLCYGVLMALAVSMTHFVPIQSTSRKWFMKRAGLAGGILATAYCVGSAVFMPLMTQWSASQGWRFTSIIFGLICGIIIMLVGFFVIRNTPESMGLHPDGEKVAYSSESSATKEVAWTVKEAIKTRQFWLLFATYALIGIPIQGALASLVMWGVDLGSSKAAAGLFMTAFTIPAIPSTIGGGWLGDRYGKKPLILICMILGALIMLYGWQGVHTQQGLLIFAIIFGLGFCLHMGLFAPYIGDLFGKASVGSLFGIITLGHGLIGGCGPTIWARTYEAFGSYNVACLISAICFAIAAIAISRVQPLKAKKAI